MAAPPETEFAPGFLADNAVLIVDSTPAARTSLAGTLVQMGGKRHRMNLVGTMDEARAEIRKTKPRIIFCDYLVGKESGLDLIQEQKQAYGAEAKQCLFVLVTSNGSQSAVAHAAEEDVDTFVIKPYTLRMFKKCLEEALKAKLQPNDYAKQIEAGKDRLAAGQVEDARKTFAEAKKLSPKPTLACFYTGQADLLKKALEDASGSFREGLSHNKIHYKCLTGLFDLLMQQKKYAAAYDVVKKIAQYFPANPKRLSSVLRLAVVTNNYSDVESYYQIFTQLDQRTDELIRYMCSALAVTGKYYLSQSTRSRGLKLFDNMAITCAGRVQFMRYAIESMLQYDCVSDAAQYMKRFPAEMHGHPDYKVSAILVAGATRPSGEVIQMARQAIDAGLEDPEVYLTLIEHSAKGGLRDTAEDLCQTAAKKWEKRTEEFRFALESVPILTKQKKPPSKART